MFQYSDDDLFGMIPKDGGHTPGNAEGHQYADLKDVYQASILLEKPFPAHLEFHGRGTSDRKSKKDLKKNEKEGLKKVYVKGFPVIDKAIEKHIAQTNGYIGAFPPVESHIYDGENIEPFHYFKHAPEEFIPDVEEELRSAYTCVHAEDARIFFWRLFWCVMAAAAALLVVVGGRVFQEIPALQAWAGKSNANASITMGIIILFLQIIGWFLPAKRLGLDFENYTPAYLIMLGLITAWGLLYFPGTMGPAPEEGVVKTIYHIIKWPYLAYFVGAFIFHLVYLIKVTPAMIEHCGNLKDNKRLYIDTYEHEVYKLCRYLRLRELWMEHAKINSTPMWLIYFENRLNKYHKEYDKLRK